MCSRLRRADGSSVVKRIILGDGARGNGGGRAGPDRGPLLGRSLRRGGQGRIF